MAAAQVLRGAASLLSVIAALAFFFAGVIIHAVSGTDRIFSEMEGFALTLLCLGLALIAKTAQDRLEEGGGLKSLDEALKK